MSNGTRPAVSLADLLSGDGPHRDLAERFVAGACIRCAAPVRSTRREGGESGLCARCWAMGSPPSSS